MNPEAFANALSLAHLDHMTDNRGLFEHAMGSEPRVEHGYCTDDNARLLTCMTERYYLAGVEPDEVSQRLSRVALQFLIDAQTEDGRIHNRMNKHHKWTDIAGTEDAWGRTVMALGIAAAHHPDELIRFNALEGYNLSVRQFSHHPRSMMFASLGAAEILAHSDPEHALSHDLMTQTIHMFEPTLSPEWVWTEPRLTYANATIPHSLILIGSLLNHPATLEKGLRMLAWLLALETRDGHLSVAPHTGRNTLSDFTYPQYDQQSIEVSAIVQACSAAYDATNDLTWIASASLGTRWFNGNNDLGERMYDPTTGAGYDGLHEDRVNLNQGAESTLALHTTFYTASRLREQKMHRAPAHA